MNLSETNKLFFPLCKSSNTILLTITHNHEQNKIIIERLDEIFHSRNMTIHDDSSVNETIRETWNQHLKLQQTRMSQLSKYRQWRNNVGEHCDCVEI